MIRKLHIINYQSHKDSELIFDEGLNIIIGNTDAGKSVIIRALKWVLFNQPRGDFFRSWWGGDTEVSVEFDDGIVTRRKTNSDNVYILEIFGSESEEFRAFSNNVPDEVSNFIQMGITNFQPQGAPAFLISDTPGAVSKYFNEIANLHEMDASLSFMKTNTQEIKQSIKTETENVKILRGKVRRFKWADLAETEALEIESIKKDLNRLETEKTMLNQISDDLRKINIEIKALKKWENIEQFYTELFDIKTDIKNREKELIEMVEMMSQIKEFSEVIKRMEKGITALPLIEEIENIKKQRRENQETINELHRIKVALLTIDKDQQSLDDSIRYAEKELEENSPEVCPLCGTKLKK